MNIYVFEVEFENNNDDANPQVFGVVKLADVELYRVAVSSYLLHNKPDEVKQYVMHSFATRLADLLGASS